MPTLEETRSVEYPPVEDLGELDHEEGEDGDDASDADASADPAPAAGDGAAVDAPAPAADAAGEGVAADKAEDKPEDKPADAGPDKAALYEQLNDHWSRDRVGFLKNMLGALSPDEQAQLLGQAPAAEEKPSVPWEPVSDAEEHYAKHYKALEALPQFTQEVSEAFRGRDHFINEALIGTSSLEAKLDAVLSFLDLELPAVDGAALTEALQDGKIGYREAVKAVYRPHLEKAVATKRQAVKPRPRTPGNGSSDQIAITKGESMADIFKKI